MGAKIIQRINLGPIFIMGTPPEVEIHLLAKNELILGRGF